MTNSVERIMTMDIVEWLRETEDKIYGAVRCNEAADEIERLREALTPFAELFLWPEDSGCPDMIRDDEDWDEKDVIIRGWIKNARKALDNIPKKGTTHG